MSNLTDSPFVMLVISLITLSLCAWLGAEVLGKYATRREAEREGFGTVLAACLTLLGLIIGFSFSMAVNRYDLRSSSEAAEATAIGTAYARADFLVPADAVKTRLLLKSYLAQRIEFFSTRDAEHLRQLDEQTTQLQRQLWLLVQATAIQQPNPLTTLTVSGMNDVINSQGNTQAAWWNRIPTEAWALMGLIAILCNTILGFVTVRDKGRGVLIVLPLAVSVAFFLIADIDSPSGGGMIHVVPQNLLSLAKLMG
jgi:hypothetical protein